MRWLELHHWLNGHEFKQTPGVFTYKLEVFHLPKHGSKDYLQNFDKKVKSPRNFTAKNFHKMLYILTKVLQMSKL